MPLWAVSSPEDLDSLRLGFTKYDLLFYWGVSNENYGQVKTIFHDMRIQVPESNQVTMRFKALKPGRVEVSLTVEVPSQISGTILKPEFTESLIVEIYPSFALLKPTPMPVESLLFSTDFEADLRINREAIGSGKKQYRVTNLPGSNGELDPNDCTVALNGKAHTHTSHRRAEITFMIAEDFGLKTWHSVTVNVKPVHYIMLNVDSRVKIKSNECVRVFPNGLDLDFYVSFHDNFGNEFDSVRSNILVESNQKGGFHFGRGESNNSIVISVVNNGYLMLKVWDDKVPHKPADYVKIHTGDVIFPFSRQMTVGDVVCFRMPLTCGEDPAKAWHVSDPHMILFCREYSVGLVLNKLGDVQVSYKSKKTLTTNLEIMPIQKIKFLQTNLVLSTVFGKEYYIPLVIKSGVDTAILIFVNVIVQKNSLLWELKIRPECRRFRVT